LERALGQQLLDTHWGYLVDHLYVQPVVDGDEPFGDLVEEARALLKATGAGNAGLAPIGRRQRADKLMGARTRAVSQLLATLAAKDDVVVAFRAKWLPDGVLARDAVPGWLKAHSDSGRRGKPGHFVECVECGQVVHFPANGEALDHLYWLQDRLRRLFLWPEYKATTFTLAGLTPLVAPLTLTYHGGPLIPYRLTCLSRVTLEVDPHMTPRELARHYATIRAQLFPCRARSLSEQRMQLAVFAAGVPELTHDAMKEWNRQHPKARYTMFKNFTRDARDAQERLLKPKIQYQV
jgi:hypothetical protein